jgi:hypothetical protein
LADIPKVEHTVGPVSELSGKILQGDSTATVENDAGSKSAPIETKLFSEDEVESAYEGAPDPIEREKAFEKLIAMLEGGTAVGVSGRDTAQSSGSLDSGREEGESGSLSAVQDDTPWPPLPPSKVQ